MNTIVIYPLGIITFIVSVIFFYVYMRSRENPENLLFAIMSFFLTIFLLARGFNEVVTTPTSKDILTNVGYTNLFLVLGAYYHFLSTYLGKKNTVFVLLTYLFTLVLAAIFIKFGFFFPGVPRGVLFHVNLVILTASLYFSGIIIKSYFDPKYAAQKQPLSAFFLGGIILSCTAIIEMISGKSGLYLEYGLMGMCLTVGLSLTNEIIRLYKTAAEALRTLEQTYLATIRAFINALDAKDPFTAGHSERVTRLSIAIAKELGTDPESLRDLRIAALLHDVGKLVISEDVLLKKETLTENEFAVVRSHATIGAEILKPIYFLRNCLPLIKSHHERPDGKGYPEGLKGNEIPVSSYLIAVAEAYDAMVTDSAFRKKMSLDEALKELKTNKGIQFYEPGVDALIKIFEREKDNLQNFLDAIPIQENPGQ